MTVPYIRRYMFWAADSVIKQTTNKLHITLQHYRRRRYVSQELWYLPTSLHGVTTQENKVVILTTVRSSNVTNKMQYKLALRYKNTQSSPITHLWRCRGGDYIQLLLIHNLGTRGGEWSTSRPGHAWAPGKGLPVPTVQEAGWAPEPFWTQRAEEESFRLCRRLNIDRNVVQSVIRHYTDWATPVPQVYKYRV
jgi:hypothetical protein